jgi:hypothetical protein
MKGKVFRNVKIEAPTEEDVFCGMIGRSKQMKQVLREFKKSCLLHFNCTYHGPSELVKDILELLFIVI